MHVVYARASAVTANPAGGTIRVREGDTWAADDPLVKARPDLFSDEPVNVRRSVKVVVVEEMTAVPGQKRRRAR